MKNVANMGTLAILGIKTALLQLQLLKFITYPFIKWLTLFTNVIVTYYLSGFAHSLNCYVCGVLPWFTHGIRQWVNRSGICMRSLAWSISRVTGLYLKKGPWKGRRQFQHPPVHSVPTVIISLLFPQPYSPCLLPALHAELRERYSTRKAPAHEESSCFRRTSPSAKLPHPTAGCDSHSWDKFKEDILVYIQWIYNHILSATFRKGR